MRCSRMALAVLAAPLFCASQLVAAAQPNFNGTWQLDDAKSPDANGASITLTIQNASGKINFQRSVREKDGKEITDQFSCSADGTECVFDENGHKAKVSLWYSGTSLMILKTDGSKEDTTTQWKLELAPGGNTLNIHCEHMEPADKSQELVYTKKT
ncbi:MAG: hypothetical protein M3Y57_22955 [Acidobacteriota bacterium]|nr:hypothetical protein [Acidobacteriota bacterium]